MSKKKAPSVTNITPVREAKREKPKQKVSMVGSCKTAGAAAMEVTKHLAGKENGTGTFDLSPSIPVRGKRVELGFSGGGRCTRARNARRWSRAKVKWEMSVRVERAVLPRYGMSVLTALIIGGVLSGCVSGNSSKQFKKAILDSFAFRSVDIYYPDGVPEDPGQVYPDLTDKQVAAIHKELDRDVKHLVRFHTKTYQHTSQLLRRETTEHAQVKLTITRTNTATAGVDPDGNLAIDLRVVQALFRASLLAEFGRSSSLTFGEALFEPGETEQETIRNFLAVKRKIEGIPARGHYGDAFAVLGMVFGDSDVFEDDPWFKLSRLIEPSFRVENRYRGGFNFLVAHELGHVALGHLEGHWDDDCDAFQQAELDADAYAVVLLTQRMRPESAILGGFFGIDEATGYSVFFDHGYELAGFHPLATNGDCPYPTTEERKTNAQAFNELVWKAREEEVEEVLRKASKRAARNDDWGNPWDDW